MANEDDLVVIPLPMEGGGTSCAVARLMDDRGHPFAEAIMAIPGTTFAPGKRIALSRYSLARIRPAAALRPELYL